MAPVGFATLYAPPQPIKHLQNASDLWLGNALRGEDDEVRLYIKAAAPHEILSECLCAVAGNFFDLPIPNTYVVHDPQQLLGRQFLIGSEDMDAPSLRQYLQVKDPNVTEALMQWARLYESTIFDEWTANPDRNQGNLLWDGGKEWHLIDQARALGAWPDGNPVPDATVGVTNHLANIVVGVENDLGAAKLRRQAAPFALKARSLDFDRLFYAAYCDTLGFSERGRDTISFMKNRIYQLPALLARHGNEPDLL